jgi:predicted nucleic acid-binding protein
MIFIDTNVLVYSTDADSPLYSVARQRLQQFIDQNLIICISNQVLREYIGVVTRLSIAKRQYNPALVRENVSSFEKEFYVLQEDRETRRRLLSLLSHTVIGGKQVHDANLVATALQHGIKAICTHNVADFKRFDTLIDIIPLVGETN